LLLYSQEQWLEIWKKSKQKKNDSLVTWTPESYNSPVSQASVLRNTRVSGTLEIATPRYPGHWQIPTPKCPGYWGDATTHPTQVMSNPAELGKVTFESVKVFIG